MKEGTLLRVYHPRDVKEHYENAMLMKFNNLDEMARFFKKTQFSKTQPKDEQSKLGLYL